MIFIAQLFLRGIDICQLNNGWITISLSGRKSRQLFRTTRRREALVYDVPHVRLTNSEKRNGRSVTGDPSKCRRRHRTGVIALARVKPGERRARGGKKKGIASHLFPARGLRLS